MGSAAWICPTEPPGYYLKVLHLVGFVSVPINFLCLYLVWFHTPKNSKFRYCLAYVQIIAFLVEVDMTWVCPGYYLFPMMGGYNIAATNRLFTGHQNTVFGAFKFCFELPSLLLCFIYRQNAAADLDQKYKLKKALQCFIITSCHTFPFVIATCLLKSELGREQMSMILRKNWPNCIHVLDHQGFVMYDPSGNIWTTTVGLASMTYISLFSLFGAYLGFHTMYVLQKVKLHMSRQTYSIHTSAMMNLALQCAVPTLFVIIPFNFIFLVVFYDWWQYQEVATNTLFLMSTHSMASSSVLIFSNQRFKNLISERLFRIPRKLMDRLTPYSIPVDHTTTKVVPINLSPL